VRFAGVRAFAWFRPHGNGMGVRRNRICIHQPRTGQDGGGDFDTTIHARRCDNKKRRAWVQRGLGTSITLHARHLPGLCSRPVSSSSSRHSGHLLLYAHAGLGPLFRLLHAGRQRALVERLTAAEPEGIPVDRARFREVDQVEHAFGIEARASLLWTAEHEGAESPCHQTSKSRPGSQT